jgi:hypothetical protein
MLFALFACKVTLFPHNWQKLCAQKHLSLRLMALRLLFSAISLAEFKGNP